MRKLTAAALLAGTAGALTWPPARHWLADVLAVTARHLDHGPDVDPPPGAIERGRRRMADAIAGALVDRARREAEEAHRGVMNGQHPTQPI